MTSEGGKPRDQIDNHAIEEYAAIVDLRSDSISKASLAMRQAMSKAESGYNYGKNPIVTELEEKAASLLGKEAALFVTSGTMANLIAVMTHCDVRGSEAYCGEESHVFLYEQGGAAQLAGVSFRTVPNNQDGSFDLKTLEDRLRPDDEHYPISKLILLENAMNGRIVPQSWINEVSIFAKKHNLKVHMDGARIWNASVGSNVSVKEIVRFCDSVSFCLSKGLGAPGGSLLCGSKSFIDKAMRFRKVLGGGSKQATALGAAGLVALEETIPILKHDHRRAFLIAKTIHELQSEMFKVDLKITETNMVLVNIDSEKITAQNFVDRLQAVLDDVEDDKIIVRGIAFNSRLIRFALYRDINDEAVKKALQKISYVIKKFDDKLKF